MSCPVSLDELSAYVDGEVGEGTSATIRQHLQHCARCAQIVASFELISTTLRRQPQVRMHRSVVADVCRAVAAQHEQRPLPCHKALPMASALLDGELSRADAARVRAHVSTCAECQAEFALMRSCTTALGERQAVQPPPTLRPQILHAVAEMPAPARRAIPRVPAWRTVTALSAAAAVAAALLLGGFSVLRGPAGSDYPAPPAVVADHTTSAPTMPASAEAASAGSDAAPGARTSEQSLETTVSPTDEALPVKAAPRRAAGPPPARSAVVRVGHDVAGLNMTPAEIRNEESENLSSDHLPVWGVDAVPEEPSERESGLSDETVRPGTGGYVMIGDADTGAT